MKRFAILRDFDPATTQEDIDAGALETLLNMASADLVKGMIWEPGLYGVSWIRTYWQPGTGWAMCLYGGETEESIEHYHSLCDVDYVEIREVSELGPESIEGTDPREEAGDGQEIIAVEGRGQPANDDEATMRQLGTLLRSAEERGGLAPSEWIRTYWDGERGVAVSFFAADARWEEVRDALEPHGYTVRRVLKVDPREYLDG